MKIATFCALFSALLCGGCAIENFDPASVSPASSSTMPDMGAKPDRQQRGAIMSGEKPDWSIVAPSYPPEKK